MTKITHEVVDGRTGKVLRQFTSSRAAYRYADRKDAAFGAVRYIVRPIAAGPL
jgi:hypothetical protein